MIPDDGASRYELKDSDHGDLFGIFLAVHAIPDALLLLHTTVGCKFKTQLHLVEHDWFRESHNQRLWTGVDDLRLIQGSGDRLVEFATTWYQRRKPAVFFVATNAVIDLSAFDVEAAVESLRSKLPCPVILLKAPGYDGGMARGYERVVEAIAAMVDWDAAADPAKVALAGYRFDRYEMDHVANLAEIRRLLRAMDLSIPALMLSGEPLATLRRAGEAGTVAMMPYARRIRPVLEARAGSRVLVDVDLPVGLTGSATFVRRLGSAAGVPAARIEAILDKELSRAVPLVEHAARRLAGTSVALFLDTDMAGAVAACLFEMGLEIPLVVLTDGDDGDEGRFRETSERLGAEWTRPPRVVVGASSDGGVRALALADAEGPVDLLVGSGIQTTFPMPTSRPRAVVQLGYPAVGKHALYPMPWMGFNGAVALAQRFLDARHLAF